MVPDSGDGATRDFPGSQLSGHEPADALHAVPPKIASRNCRIIGPDPECPVLAGTAGQDREAVWRGVPSALAGSTCSAAAPPRLPAHLSLERTERSVESEKVCSFISVYTGLRFLPGCSGPRQRLTHSQAAVAYASSCPTPGPAFRNRRASPVLPQRCTGRPAGNRAGKHRCPAADRRLRPRHARRRSRQAADQ